MMSPTINLVHEYLIGDEEAEIGDPVTSDATPELKTQESQSDEKTDPIDQVFDQWLTLWKDVLYSLCLKFIFHSPLKIYHLSLLITYMQDT